MLKTLTTVVIAALLATPAFAGMDQGGAEETQTDTTVVVVPGTRLDMQNFGGAVVIEGWGKNAVRIAATHPRRTRVLVDLSGATLGIRASARRLVTSPIDYHVSLPKWMAITLNGVYTDISIQGVKAQVDAQTVRGDVTVDGGEGYLKLGSVQGAINVQRARGRIEASSVNEDVNVEDSEGDISVDAVNGSVNLERVRSNRIQIQTVNGDIRYRGTIANNGMYRFNTHDGDIDVAVPDRTNATFAVATFSGDFESSFPIAVMAAPRGKRFSFAIGTGSAQVDLETFQGTIHLEHGERRADADDR